MSDKCKEAESPATVLKDQAARQRWELFHRAIAHAKHANDASAASADTGTADEAASRPVLTVVK
jgi:hypothetical protein